MKSLLMVGTLGALIYGTYYFIKKSADEMARQQRSEKGT